MERRPTVPSGIGMALQQHGDTREVKDNADAAKGRPVPLRGSRGRSVSEAHVFSQVGSGLDGKLADATLTHPHQLRTQVMVEGNSAKSFDSSEYNDMPPLSPAKDGIFKDFCRGQPPRRSFLGTGSQTPPRLRMARRSTLADKPELDDQLKAVMVSYKDELFLPLTDSTVLCIAQYLNGSKPLAYVDSAFKRLLINSETNCVRAGLFISALEQIGLYCEHLAIVAPFHTTEFSHNSDYEAGNPELGSDWEKILGCFPNIRKITFQDQTKEPTTLARDTFSSFYFAFLKTSLQEYVRIEHDVSRELLFGFHHDYHSRQQARSSPDSLTYASTPLTMVGSDMIYADGTEDLRLLDDGLVFGLLDDDLVFGKADGIDW